MDDQLNIKNITIGIFGCIFIFILPIVGILAIWNFDTENLKHSLKSLFVLNSKTEEETYNFAVSPGEDALLTDTVKAKSNYSTIESNVIKSQILIIDSADINGPIVYGTNGEEQLKNGFWHHPGTKLPGEKGNTVIFGHRRYHLPPATDTFYHLDKVTIDDSVEIQLKNGDWLEYIVTNIEIINPNELNKVLTLKTQKDQIKLITCTPLGTSEKRLIVTAERFI